MTWFIVYVTLRASVAGVSLLTATYAIAAASPFAFDMFIRPQLFPWLTAFVTWHHLWFAGAYAIGIASVAPELRQWHQRGSQSLAGMAALGYVVVVGIMAAWLLVSPYLPTVWGHSNPIPTLLLSLLPVLLLSTTDHIATWPQMVDGQHSHRVLGQRRLLICCGAAAGFVWAVHFVSAVIRTSDLLGLALGGQGKTGHLSTLQNRPFPVSGIEAE
jgi:hypothetical protein